MSLSNALELHDRGYAVLPLASRSKAPAGAVLAAYYGDASWARLREQRATKQEITDWHRLDPDINVGIILGRPSGGVVVLDLDKPAPRRLFHPATPAVRSGRGRHLYFVSGVPIKSMTLPGGHGEVRGDGAYVVAPGSMHPSGRKYEWVVTPDECEYADIRELSLPWPAVESRVHARSFLPSEEISLHSVGPRGIRGYASDPSAVSQVLRVFRVNLTPEEVARHAAFSDVLPGMGADRHPSASIFLHHDSGVYLYCCWRRGQVYLTLAEVYASVLAGEIVRLPTPSRYVWYLRLAHAAGLIVPQPICLPNVEEVDPVTGAVAAGFELLVGLRRAEGNYEPTPYTRRFAAIWCRGLHPEGHRVVSEWTAQDAIRRMTMTGAIRAVGRRKRARLFIPGGDV